jgi:hypothetical protein
MAKKTKKRSGAPRLTERQLHRPGSAPSAVPTFQAAGVPAQLAGDELADEYRYVLTDLKKIAWLALAMLALLIVLAFVIV